MIRNILNFFRLLRGAIFNVLEIKVNIISNNIPFKMPPKITNKRVIRHNAAKVYKRILHKFESYDPITKLELKFYKKLVRGRKYILYLCH